MNNNNEKWREMSIISDNERNVSMWNDNVNEMKENDNNNNERKWKWK